MLISPAKVLSYYSVIMLWILIADFSAKANSEASNTSNILSTIDEIHQIAELDFGQIDRSTDISCILAEVKPKPYSGSLHIGTSYIDGATGKLVNIPGGRDTLMINGSFHIIAVLDGNIQKKDWSYEWKIPFIPFDTRTIKKNPLADYALFVKGGTAIFYLDGLITDPANVLPIYAIPQKWQDFVLPAWKYYQANLTLFQAQDSSPSKEKLKQLLESENPFLAIAACRALAKDQLLDKAFVDGPLAEATGLKQAVFTFLLLSQSQRQEAGEKPEGNVKTAEAELIGSLNLLISEARGADKFHGIALGALAGLRELDASGSVRAFRVLETLEKRLAIIDKSTPSGRSIAEIIKMAALPLLRNNHLYSDQTIKPAPK